MLYTDKGVVNPETGSPLHPRYEHFGNPFVFHERPRREDVVIVPETETQLALDADCHIRIVWWLSVDNYLIGGRSIFLKGLAKIVGCAQRPLQRDLSRASADPLFADKSIVHAYQSFYAASFLEGVGVSSPQTVPLSDYLDERFLKESSASPSEIRRNIALYNPRKKGRIVQEALRIKDDRFSWVALEGLTEKQLIQEMSSAKVYVDFGGHPGKDRLPREAALCGCCIITGLRGSAANEVDVPIPARFKLDDEQADPRQLIDMIAKLMMSHEESTREFEEYRVAIREEKRKFQREVDDLVRILGRAKWGS